MVKNVRALYKRILKLHHYLPPDLKAIGDQYFKAEFKLHKTAEPEFVPPFLKQWEDYAQVLEGQIAESLSENRKFNPRVGVNISPKVLDNLDDGQVLQLFELKKETTKPNRQFNIQDKQNNDS